MEGDNQMGFTVVNIVNSMYKDFILNRYNTWGKKKPMQELEIVISQL